MPVLQNPTALYHLGETSLILKGPVTGNTYLFGARAELTVDGHDVPALLATNRFATLSPDA